MPDDSSSEFKASQSRHAQKIAFERGLMEQTGLTRNQVRAGLRAFNERIESRGAVLATANVPTPVSQNLPRLGDAGAKFEPRPFLQGQQESSSSTPKIKELPDFPTANGDYVLTLTVADGEPTLAWEEILDCE